MMRLDQNLEGQSSHVDLIDLAVPVDLFIFFKHSDIFKINSIALSRLDEEGHLPTTLYNSAFKVINLIQKTEQILL